MIARKVIMYPESMLPQPLYSIDELTGMGIVIEPGASVSIEKPVTFILSSASPLTLSGSVTIKKEATIIYDEKMGNKPIIRNSYIDSNTRIWNAQLLHTFCSRGSQVIFDVSMDLDQEVAPDTYLLILGPGMDHEETNFAQTRGGVVKRCAIALRKGAPITVPTGHSLLTEKELNSKVRSMPENKEVTITPVASIDTNVIVNSGFCHPQRFDSLFDPAVFGGNQLLSSFDDQAALQVDLTELIKSRTDQAVIERAAGIRQEAYGYETLAFRTREGYIVVTRVP